MAHYGNVDDGDRRITRLTLTTECVHVSSIVSPRLYAHESVLFRGNKIFPDAGERQIDNALIVVIASDGKTYPRHTGEIYRRCSARVAKIAIELIHDPLLGDLLGHGGGGILILMKFNQAPRVGSQHLPVIVRSLLPVDYPLVDSKCVRTSFRVSLSDSSAGNEFEG